MKTCVLAVFFAAVFAAAQTSGRFVQAELLTTIKTKKRPWAIRSKLA